VAGHLVPRGPCHWGWRGLRHPARHRRHRVAGTTDLTVTRWPELVFTHPGDPFQIVLQASLVLGTLLALPVILYHLWACWLAAIDHGQLQVFDSAASRIVATLDTSNGSSDLAISPNSRWLAMARDHAVLIWPLAREDMIAQACARLSRNLSDAEWKKYRPTKGTRRPTCKDLPLAP
jgi:Sec-independent protein translocase protein (TatC)